MRIAIVMGHLRMGGTERVVSILCKQFVKLKDEVILINIGHQDSNFYELPVAVKQISLNMDRYATNRFDTLVNVLRRVWKVRQTIKQSKPDVVMSFTDRTNVIALLANIALPYPLIISIRAHPDLNRLFLRSFTRIIYRFATAIVSVSSGTDNGFSHIDEAKRNVIGNPVREIFLDDQTTVPAYSDNFAIVSLGRFSKEKNHALLLKAFSNLASQFSNWELHLYGDGNEYGDLENLMKSLNITECVFLHPPVHDVVPILNSATIYVQPSNSEGFPNAVLEAMASNLPVIVTDYPGNPRDFITHNETGIIVPVGDENALTDALQALMLNPEKRRQLGKSAGYVRDIFSTNNIIQQWYDVIESVVEKR